MDTLNLLLDRLDSGFNVILQYFGNREVILVFAASFVLVSLVLINLRHLKCNMERHAATTLVILINIRG
jgi:hypothetical protein